MRRRLGSCDEGDPLVLAAALAGGDAAGDGPLEDLSALGALVGVQLDDELIDPVDHYRMAERSVRARLIRAIQAAPDPPAAVGIIRDEIEPELEPLAGPEDREALYRAMFKHLKQDVAPKTGIEKADLYGGVACFFLVVASCLPVVIPFLIFSNPTRALRVSNFLLIAMLFVVGRKWAAYANTNRLVAGLAMVTIGLLLVGIAVLLGG